LDGFVASVVLISQKGPDLLIGASPSLAREDRCTPEPAIPGKLTPQKPLVG